MLGCFFFILNSVGIIFFPLLGFYAIDNGNIMSIIIICSVYSIYYIIVNNLVRGEILRILILYITTFLSVRTYEIFNPFIMALIEYPLIDLGVTLIFSIFVLLKSLFIKFFKINQVSNRDSKNYDIEKETNITSEKKLGKIVKLRKK